MAELELDIFLDVKRDASVDIPTPAEAVTLKVPPRSQSGHKLRLRGRGFLRSTEVDDRYGELEVHLPDREDPQLATAARAAAALYERPLREGITR